MKADPLDNFVNSAAPPVKIADSRVHDLTTAVQMRIDHLPSTGRIAFPPPSMPSVLPRYALPMATAALLGVLLGSAVLPQREAMAQRPPLLSLISATAPSQPLGF
ncbi:hypothetical protein [Telmatospirillum siberiense]|uniref:Uncharacterized protein n=1 Tax=Telmatospirillum siberiense TaxID=382514 RepID=A0A2N3PVF0_9PROT|nr:hypothetical protein [Telmatospirillum siberiense]PKU24371.1 hypothetical protein CWS72_12335 [Telmatospirillum siberiense]